MKRKRGAFTIAAALLLAVAVLPCGALAAGTEEAETADPAPVVEQEQTAPVPAPSAVYPAEVRASEENGVHYLEKVYCLTVKDDPAAIPTADFDREGRTYTLLDILKNDQTETDTKDYIEIVTLNSETKDMAEIIKQLAPELEVTTEDGYTGVLKADYPGITVEAAGYKTSSWTVSATRTYPNLSEADISLVPKTTEDSGRTLTLADVDWQEAATDHTDGYDLPMRYTAVATYTGTATGKYATGYTVTVEYAGEVTKTSCDSVIYTAIFASHGETQTVEDDGEAAAPLPTEAPTDSEEDSGAGKGLLLIPVGVALLAGAGYGGYKSIKYYKDKKRGYVK